MLHKMKSISGSIFQDKTLSQNQSPGQVEKRKFLGAAALGLLSVLPFIQFFKLSRHKTSYFFLASINRNKLLNAGNSNFRNKEMLNALDNKMFKEKKILKLRSVSLKDKISWLYVFDSKKSRWEWGNEILKHKMFFSDKLTHNNLHLSQIEGFLN